jgi:hypothetical protein
MNNLNADFLLDIWADLKAKRLAPIAVGMGVALVAIPALMLKGEDTPAAGPLPIVPVASSGDAAEVELAEELAEGGSKLDSYKARDPFDGLVKPEADNGLSGAAVAPGDAGSGEADDSLSKALGGVGGSSPSDDKSSTPSLGGSGGGLTTGGDNPPVVVRKPGSKFTYQLDVKFGRPGREKRYPHLSRMSFLPSADVPALLFMGVPEDAKSALFFVHPSLSHAGEGVCVPSKAECNFLKLAIGRDHYLSVNDYEFRIRLLDINRVKLSKERKQRTQARKSARLRSGRGEGPLGGEAQGAAHDWPLLVDGIG